MSISAAVHGTLAAIAACAIVGAKRIRAREDDEVELTISRGQGREAER